MKMLQLNEVFKNDGLFVFIFRTPLEYLFN